MSSKLDRIHLSSTWVNRTKCWFSNYLCNIAGKKNFSFLVLKTELLSQVTGAKLNKGEKVWHLHLFWFRAVLQFWVKFPSHGHLLAISWIHRVISPHMDQIPQVESERGSRYAPNVRQLLPGTQALGEINPVNSFKWSWAPFCMKF